MKKKYYLRTLAISLAAMLLFGISSVLLINFYAKKMAEEDLIRLSAILIDYAQKPNADYKEISTFNNSTGKAFRISFIDSEGNVFADTIENTVFENHLNRPEVKSALDGIPALYIRYSDTQNCTMMYYAITFTDNSGGRGQCVLRVALEITSVHGLVLSSIPVLIAIMLILAALLALVNSKFNNNMMMPINALKGELHNINRGEFNKLSIDKSNKEMLPVINEINEIGETLLKLNKIRSEFFANASHELNTPLTSISGYSELMEQGLLSDTEKIKECGMKIKKETARMATLINDMLCISKLESNETVVFEKVNISEIINSSVESLSSKAKEKNIKINVQCWETYVLSNENLLKSIILNLLDNAIKYNKPRGSVFLSVNTKDGKGILSVKDTGIGIDKEDTERIFERFYRVDKARSRHSGGTGLGLAIVKHSVLKLGGTITVESEKNTGSEFIAENIFKSV